MKVLLVNSVCGILSTGRIVADIAEQYIADGHTCRIAYGRGEVPEKYKNIVYKIGNNFDVYINVVKARIWDNEGFNAKQATKKFIEWLNAYKPDLIWLHNLHGYYINVEMLFKWIKKNPQIEVRWTLHDCWAFTGHCSHFSLIRCSKWMDECDKCSQKGVYPRSCFKNNCKKNFRRKRNSFQNVNKLKIITPSKWLKDLVEQSILKDYEVEVVYNVIDKSVFHPTESKFREKYGLKNKKIILGVASVWDTRKGIEDFVRLADILDESYKIVLVGLIPRKIKKRMKKILCITRTNSKQELAEIYSASDVFVNLTYEDNYPTVNLEAQACGVECITYNTGGSVESVRPENVVEQGNIDGVLKTIKRILEKEI